MKLDNIYLNYNHGSSCCQKKDVQDNIKFMSHKNLLMSKKLLKNEKGIIYGWFCGRIVTIE